MSDQLPLLRFGTAGVRAPLGEGPGRMNEGTVALVATAVARHLRDGSPAVALGRAPIVDFDRSDAHQNHYYRRLTRRHPTGPRHYIPSSHDHVRAIVAGLGWGLIPEQLATPWLVSGEIVDVSPEQPLDVPLFWQHWKLQSPDLDALTAAVLDTARTELRT